LRHWRRKDKTTQEKTKRNERGTHQTSVVVVDTHKAHVRGERGIDSIGAHNILQQHRTAGVVVCDPVVQRLPYTERADVREGLVNQQERYSVHKQ